MNISDDNDDSHGSDNGSDYSFDADHHFVMESEMLEQGLKLVGCTDNQINSSKEETNKKRFNHAFGASLMTLYTVYEDLQTTSIVFEDEFVVQISGNDVSLKWLLISIHFLRKYPTGPDKEYIFNLSERHS